MHASNAHKRGSSKAWGKNTGIRRSDSVALAGPLAGIPAVPAEQLYEHMRHNELMSMAHMDTCDAGGPGAGGAVKS